MRRIQEFRAQFILGSTGRFAVALPTPHEANTTTPSARLQHPRLPAILPLPERTPVRQAPAICPPIARRRLIAR